MGAVDRNEEENDDENHVENMRSVPHFLEPAIIENYFFAPLFLGDINLCMFLK